MSFNWKQRFFIPTDETTGIEILSALLDRYPVVVGEEEANETETNLAELEIQRQMTPTNVVDLDQWIIAADESNSADETAHEINSQLEVETLALKTMTEEVRLARVGRGSKLYSNSSQRFYSLAWTSDQHNSVSF